MNYSVFAHDNMGGGFTGSAGGVHFGGFRFDRVPWPTAVIPSRCILCGRPASHNSEFHFVNATPPSLLPAVETLKVMLPTCLATEDLCPSAEAKERRRGLEIELTWDAKSLKRTSVNITIPCCEWAEAFARANDLLPDFHYQLVMYYVFGGMPDIPSQEAVSTVRSDVEALAHVAVGYARASSRKKAEVLGRFRQISLSFTADHLAGIRGVWMRQRKFLREIFVACVVVACVVIFLDVLFPEVISALGCLGAFAVPALAVGAAGGAIASGVGWCIMWYRTQVYMDRLTVLNESTDSQ